MDNARDFFRMPLLGKSAYEYVPQIPKGTVLYTTPNRDIAVDLASNQDLIHVGLLSTKEADQLLDKYVRDASTSDERLKLLRALDHLPLAITQAVAFTAKRRKSIAQYLELFEKSDTAKACLLNYGFSRPWPRGKSFGFSSKNLDDILQPHQVESSSSGRITFVDELPRPARCAPIPPS